MNEKNWERNVLFILSPDDGELVFEWGKIVDAETVVQVTESDLARLRREVSVRAGFRSGA